jgi:fatty-acyl-CoA synthase
MSMTPDGLSCWQAETAGEILLEMTIGECLDQRAEEFPTKEAIVYSCYPEFGGALDIRWTYAAYHDQVNAVAKGLLALGLRRGDHIAVWAANVPEWPLLQMGAAKAGLVLVTINPLLRAAEVEYILNQGEVQALFLMARVRDHDCLATIRSLVAPGTKQGEVTSERLPKLRALCLVGAPPPDLLEQHDWSPTLFPELVVGGEAISDEALRERQASVTPADPALLLYTSGTTGLPKGALLTQRSVLNNGRLLQRQLGMDETCRLCIPMPFFHGMGCVCGTLGMLGVGGTLHPLLAFDPLKMLQIISTERCNAAAAVPTMLLALLQHPELSRYDLSCLKLVGSGGAPVPVALMEQVKARLGADVGIGFGQTEATAALTATKPEDSFARKSATVGVPLPSTEIKLIDPANGEIVPVGERGELCARGYTVMVGYYQMPERTAETIDPEGWLHTGDLATMDAEGYVNIVGRLKDMVIRGGENLFPREIEEFLLRHPKVSDVAVLGVPDAFFGEEVLAVVIPKAGETVTQEELRAFFTGQISRQKIPRYWKFTDAFPLTGSGKVQKFLLREQAIQEWHLEEAARTRTA